jgi:prolyl oligopeptidase
MLGDPDNEEDFEYLLTYYPLKQQKYPATLIVTSDHDDRVVSLHSNKHILELQYQNPLNHNPSLLLYERKHGHGAGKPLKKWLNHRR